MIKKTKIITTFTIVLIFVGTFTACQSSQLEKTDVIVTVPTYTEKLSETTKISEESLQDEPKKTDFEEEFISQRIVNYTTEYFRFTENVEVNTEDGKTFVAVTFVPEVGSIVIKEEIYESVANHAYQITKFFPEVTYFDYIILSQDDNTKDEVLYLTIDENAVGNIEVNYLNQLNRRYYGDETQFVEVFSEIVETEESKEWRERVDPDAEIP